MFTILFAGFKVGASWPSPAAHTHTPHCNANHCSSVDQEPG
jgi:hypothetical protein